jgi:hypothetical protein
MQAAQHIRREERPESLPPSSLETTVMDQDEFEIGVCDADFNVFARITMRGAAGVRRLQGHLAEMGYRPVTVGSSEQLRGCDLLLVRAPVLAPH